MTIVRAALGPGLGLTTLATLLRSTMRQHLTGDPRRWRFGHNLRLVLGVLDLWPRTTAVLFTVLGVGGAFSAREIYGLSNFETALAGVAYLLCLAWLKALLVFLFYPTLYRARFDGSFFLVAVIVMALLFAGLAILAYLASVHERPVPAILVTVGAAGYFLLAFVFAAAFRVSQWMQRDTWVPWRKLDER